MTCISWHTQDCCSEEHSEISLVNIFLNKKSPHYHHLSYISNLRLVCSEVLQVLFHMQPFGQTQQPSGWSEFHQHCTCKQTHFHLINGNIFHGQTTFFYKDCWLSSPISYGNIYCKVWHVAVQAFRSTLMRSWYANETIQSPFWFWKMR